MKLLIVESPSKAKTIEKYLEGAFTVRASVGHIRDLPKSNKKAIDIEAGFVPHYEISKGKEKKAKLTLACSEEPRDEKLVERIMEEGKNGVWKVSGVKESEQKRSPRAPFTTSTLQQTASSRLGYSPSRTMQIAQ